MIEKVLNIETKKIDSRYPKKYQPAIKDKNKANWDY